MSTDTTIRDLMHDADNLMTADEPVKNARQQFELETTRSLILVDGSGPVGLLTRSTMRTIPDSDLDLPARDFAVAVPILQQSQTLSEARNDMEGVDFDADRIPVVNEEGRFVGVIDRDVVLREVETIVTGRGTVMVNGDADRRYLIEVGMEVMGDDGNKLGKVDQIVLERDHVASFTIEHGFLGRHHKRVKAEHVKNVDNEAVYLDFGKTEFGFLADVEDLEEDSKTSIAAS